MILYCIICYLIMLGVVLGANDKDDRFEYGWALVLFAPLLLPMFIGIELEKITRKR
jgi:hypothetical protein